MCGGYAAIMRIYSWEVIAYFMVCEKQVSKICAPFLIDFIRGEISFQLIIEYLMRFSMTISRLIWTDNRTGYKLCVHIFINSGGTVRIASTLQIGFHTLVPVNSVV